MPDSLVSIIIPVYNAEKYLESCLASILNQTYNNIEVILVNDGSTDRSANIGDEYCKNHTHIKILHQRNSGPSIARNKGIEVANGEYIQFVDSDDYLEPNMVEKLVHAIKQDFQLAISGYKSVYMDQDGKVVIQGRHSPSEDQYKKLDLCSTFGELFINNFINPLWNKLYLASLIKEFNVRFLENVNMGEDLLFNLEYIKLCQRITVIKDLLYNYIIFNNDSLTGSFRKDMFYNQKMLFIKVREFLMENNCYVGRNQEIIEEMYARVLVSCIESLFHFNSGLESKGIKERINEVLHDDDTTKSGFYFKNGNLQKKLVGIMVKYKLVNSIYSFFLVKNFLRTKMGPVFRLLKGLNTAK